MNPVIIGNATLYHGDCIDLLRTLSDDSIEACLTDPPYGLSNHTEADIRACMAAWLAGKPYQHKGKGFMNAEWDSFVPGPEMWKELHRVLKPGAHLLVFAGTRTADLMSLALRLAGFECKETIMWTFGSGFPKSLNISKSIDKMKGKLETQSVGFNVAGKTSGLGTIQRPELRSDHPDYLPYIPKTKESEQWNGWFSHIKPAYEPILLFRKPLDGTIAENTLKWGTGGLNVDGCRIGISETEAINSKDFRTTAPNCSHIPLPGNSAKDDKKEKKPVANSHPLSLRHNAQGRYPGNLIVSSDEEVERCFPVTSNSFRPSGSRLGHKIKGIFNNGLIRDGDVYGHNDSGSASRFFQHCDYSVEEIAEMNGIELKRIVYSGKASRVDRDQGLEGFEEKQLRTTYDKSVRDQHGNDSGYLRRNTHPTCKPTSLLRYCLRMITPPGGTVIDPFFGSGSTGKAALLEGFNVIGIEREPEYFEIAQARCAYVAPEVMTVKPSSSESAQRQEKLF